MPNDTVFRRFLSYIEVSTKLAGVIPFIIALGFCYYSSGYINISATIWLFVAVELFDMATTMINNYIDRRADGKEGYFSRPVMLILIFAAVIPSLTIGVILSYYIDITLLFAGGFCAFIGIAYTFGPAPISKSPYGEVVSGFTEGFVLPLMVGIVNMPRLFNFAFTADTFTLALNWQKVGGLFWACVPPMLCIANIMLANNICDYEPDMKTRYTLVRHIGIKHALHLYVAIYAASYAAVLSGVAFGVLPFASLFIILTVPIVVKHTKLFFQKQVKGETFILTIKNFVVILVPYAVTLFVGGLLQ